MAIYIFYEKNGKVGDYVIYCINGLKEVAKDILVVVNGSVNDDGLQKLKDLNVKVLQRENAGFDFAAYKVGIEHIGYDKLKNYDELILTNNSYYGPIYPFSEMFDEMAKRDCDFWGINRHPKTNDFIKVNSKKYYIIEHIQSYFLVFKQKLLKSNDFKQYWDNLKIFSSFEETVACGELELTKYFENLNYTSKTYMDFEKYKNLFLETPTLLLEKQVVEDRCPIIKRKNFNHFIYSIAKYKPIIETAKCVKFLEQYNLALKSIMIADILKNSNSNDFYDSINKTVVLDALDSYAHTDCVVLFFDIYNVCNINLFLKYIKNIDKVFKIYILIDKHCYILDNLNMDNVEIFIRDNYFDFNNKIIQNYKYICYINDNSDYLNSFNTSRGNICIDDILSQMLNSLVYSNNHIYSILNLFDNDNNLGIVKPFIIESSVGNFYNNFNNKNNYILTSSCWFRSILIDNINENLEELFLNKSYEKGYYACLVVARNEVEHIINSLDKKYDILQQYLIKFNWVKYAVYKLLSIFFKDYRSKYNQLKIIKKKYKNFILNTRR